MSFGIPSTDVQRFSAVGASNWNKPKGAKWVKIQLISGGGGGQNGTVVAPGAVNGGIAGQGGGYGEINLPADVLGAVEIVTIGAGGAGGISGGAAAQPGGNTSFGNWLFTRAGNIGGINGRGSGFPTGVSAATTTNITDTGADNTVAGISSLRGGAGGGAGGGFVSSVALIAPLPGGSTGPASATTPGTSPSGIVVGAAGGLIGAPNGGNGNDTIVNAVWGGSGGGGGLSAIAGNGGNGGNGVKGAGGGGGASAFTGFTAGNGGNGGNGFAIITTFF